MKMCSPLQIFFVAVFVLIARLTPTDGLNTTSSESFSDDNESNACNYFCPAKSNTTEFEPPKFEQPCTPKDVQRIYYTEQGSNYAVIRWTKPKAFDGKGDIPKIEQVYGGANNSNFLGTILGISYRVVYLAIDNNGLADNCFFNFTIIIPSCPMLPIVQNGSFTCTNTIAPGSSCMISCEEGFRLSGPGNTTCQYPSKGSNFPNWENVKSCEKIRCGSPIQPDHAEITCSDNDFSYHTACKVKCHQGYLPIGPLFTLCEANGKWSTSTICTKKNTDVDQCSSSVCNGHNCIQNQNGTFSCKCSHDWSGSACQTPPDYCSANICLNEATCSSHNGSYTCNCRSGYSGYVCQQSPVNGHWSDWSVWSQCSVTCGFGFQTRHRSCSNPPPDKLGQICHGPVTDETGCEKETCKVCSELKQTNVSLTIIDCTTNQTTDLNTCTVTCRNGTVHTPWFKDFETHKCGFETNYTWIPGNIEAPCVVPVIPEELRIEIEAAYQTIIPTIDYPVVKQEVIKNIENTSCGQSTKCNATILLSSAQVKRNLETKLNLILQRYFDITLKNETSNLDETVKQEIASAISELESTAEYIKRNTGDVFDISTANTSYVIEEYSLRVEGFVKCSTGFIPINGLCVQCPAGTFESDNTCSFCPRGTFQSLPGQNTCIACPSGHTTYTIGSTYIVQCYVHTEEANEETDILEKGSYVAAIIGPLIALFVGIPGFAWFYNKRKAKNEEKKLEENTEQRKAKNEEKKLEENTEQSNDDKRTPNTEIESIKVKDSNKHCVRVESDTRKCDIVSACTLEDGTILLSDHDNKKLKRLDSSTYTVIDYCDLPGRPWQVCSIKKHQAAVCLPRQKEVHFISLSNRMTLTNKITTDFLCYGLAFADGNLYISDENTSVYIYSVLGKKLKQFSKDQSGQKLFSDIIWSLAVSEDGSRIYVADHSNGLIILDNEDKIVGKYNGSQLKYACDSYLTGRGSLIVCGRNSNNVLQFRLDGALIGEVVQDDGVYIQAICCNQQMSKMIIGRLDDEIKVYDI